MPVIERLYHRLFYAFFVSLRRAQSAPKILLNTRVKALILLYLSYLYPSSLMLQRDDSNTIFSMAVDLVNDTSQHLFLTGKAGTGKTTFLRYIKEHTKKNSIVVAPTGVAAINAGGVTMHSFFQLPRGLFVPGMVRRDGLMGFVEVTDKHSLFKNIHFTSNKRQLLQELELLVIDEVSMMRSDMLDAIDTILRHFRRAPHMPFGGVQVLYIGDMYQLPPVVQHEEWEIMQQYYQSPFFFHAKVIAEAPPLYIELKKIYRQNEQRFIDVLNNIRNNTVTKLDFEFLNNRYQPEFVSTVDDHYITITTHNKKADTINAAELAKLPGKLHTFKATIKDEFYDKAFPTELELQLKEGAQIMFIKNDSGGERRYFNGKLATVKKIYNDSITVTFNDNGEDLELEKETWKNIRYIYNKDNDNIDEEILGSFTQYPIRLAWAITVHKSQGLTFNKAVIDAGSSFAAGQVYVALSRCTTLDGLVLKSRILPHAISTDRRIVEFAQSAVEDVAQLEEKLEKEKYRHWGTVLIKAFDLSKVIGALNDWIQIIPEKKVPDTQAVLNTAQNAMAKVRELQEVAKKFQRQLEVVLHNTYDSKDTTLLKERMEKAVKFFGDAITKEILLPVQEHKAAIHYVSRLNKYKEEVNSVESVIWQQVQKLAGSRYGQLHFADPNAYHRYDPALQKVTVKKTEIASSKGGSNKLTLELFKEGKTIDEIASMRSLAISTVEGHLAPFVLTGEIEARELVEEAKIESILKVIEVVGPASAGSIKSRLGESFSFHEIRVAVNHYRHMNKQTA